MRSLRSDPDWQTRTDDGRFSMNAFALTTCALTACALAGCAADNAPAPQPIPEPADPAFSEAVLAVSPDVLDVTFAPGGVGVAYTQRKGDEEQVFLNALRQDPRPLKRASLFLSASGKRLAFFAFPQEESSHHMGLDGELSPPYQKVWPPIFSPDGKRVAYGVKVDGRERMIVDGEVGEPFDNVYVPVFSADGAQLVYPARTGERYWLVRGGKRGETYDGVWHPAFSPVAPIVAFGGQRGDRRFVVIGGVEGPAYDSLGDPVWSPDGSRVVYPAKTLKQWKLATARVTHGPQGVKLEHSLDERTFDAIGLPTFSRSGTVAFVAERAKASVIVVGPTVGTRRDLFNHTLYMLDSGERESPIVLSPDGKRWACRITPPKPGGGLGVGSGDHRVLVDGRPGPAFARVGRPVFSPDGKSLAYAAGPRGGPGYLVLDDRPIGPYVQVGTPRFDAESKRVAFGAAEMDGSLRRRVASVERR